MSCNLKPLVLCLQINFTQLHISALTGVSMSLSLAFLQKTTFPLPFVAFGWFYRYEGKFPTIRKVQSLKCESVCCVLVWIGVPTLSSSLLLVNILYSQMFLLLMCAQMKMALGCMCLGLCAVESFRLWVLPCAEGIVKQCFAGVYYRWAKHVFMFSKSPQNHVYIKPVETEVIQLYLFKSPCRRSAEGKRLLGIHILAIFKLIEYFCMEYCWSIAISIYESFK